MSKESERTDRDIDLKAMEMIRASDVLNPSITLDRIMALTQRLAALEPVGGPEAREKDTFIGPWFIYKHETNATLQQAVE